MYDVDFDHDGALALARELYALATWLGDAAGQRRTASDDALATWTGPHADTFAAQATQEQTETGSVRSALIVEAHDWAQAWTDAVNDRNRRSRERRLDQIDGPLVLLRDLVGDDPRDRIPDLDVVTRPEPPDFAPTGGLQEF